VTHAKAVKEFLELNNVDEYYYATHDSENYRDDTFEIFYTEKAAA